MQDRGEVYAISMSYSRKRHPQAPCKCLLGPVVGMLTPSEVAQPARRTVNSSRPLRLVWEQRCSPFLEPVALEAESALPPGNRGAACNQWIALPLKGGDEAVGIALAQSKGR